MDYNGGNMRVLEVPMTVGDLMQEARRRAFRSLVLFLGIAAYAVALIYAGVHNYALLSRGVPPELIIFALLGLFGLEISAVALPLAVHFWTAPGLHRIAALAFYAVDALLLFGNSILDFHLNANLDLPAWMDLYLRYIAPATPLVVGAMWAALFILDPANRLRDVEMEMAAAARLALAARIAEAARAAEVNEIVEAAARQMAMELAARAVGRPVRLPPAPRPALNGAGPAPEPDGQEAGPKRP
jgi:hypothetical protein